MPEPEQQPADDSARHVPAPAHRYRSSREAPDTIKEQTQILFEEDIYHLAIQDLQSNLFSQSYLSPDKPLWVAPPNHIALLGTLVIHPLHTTWARENGKHKKMVSVQAHQYLLDVLRSVGPVNGHFKAAFSFRDRAARADRRRRHSPDGGDVGSDDLLTTPLANEDSIWSRVPDFWVMLGWAFSCAVSHPERWAYWKLWLELLLEVLERDVEERIALDEERGDSNYPMLKDSMLRSYVGEHQLGHIMYVLFAYIDNGSHSYKEIWPMETVERNPAATNKRKWDAKVDLENGEYGDWFESEGEDFGDEDDVAQSADTGPGKTRARSKRGSKPKKQHLPLVENPALVETIPFRRRLFALISKLCFKLPNGDVQFNVYSIYDDFAGYVRGLPLDVFPHFVWSGMPVVPGVYASLIRYVLAYLLPPGVPQPGVVDSVTDTNGFVSPIMMEKCFLPFAANSVVADNARLAVVLWELFSFLWRDRTTPELGPEIPSSLKTAILVGLEQREKKSKMKNEGPDDDMLERGWDMEKKMGLIQEDPYAPANVLRLAHSKFRLLLEKSADADVERQAGKDSLEADFIGWK
jgi:hypothetical protein